ncbi:UGSC family (seleno)protein [Actinomadura sp. 9N215]|uniref:UGSC family (seleno)protein n=1 Tax=Actinomadura sp. 9N215 TaxID=3375150 RepID=UPI0037AB48B1
MPTVGVHSRQFHRIATNVARTKGMPRMRQAYLPGAISGRSATELTEYIKGTDAVSGRPFMDELLDALAGRLDEEDLKGSSYDRPRQQLVEAADEPAAHALFLENRWTDGLPIVLPTEERIGEMLAGTSRRPDEVVGRLAPAKFRERWEFTVEKVAVNAVMAGAGPEHFPIILALASSGVTARMSSLTSMATISIVNGPIRLEAGMNTGMGAMGPYSRANATIGRAYGLLSQNLQGGSVPGETYMGTLGNNYGYTATFPENEEDSPWEPLHVQHGFRPDESAVSLFLGGWYTISGASPRRKHWKEMLRGALRACDPAFAPLVVMDPTAAKDFVEAGFPGKDDVRAWLARNGRMSADEYWSNGVVRAILRPLALAGEEPHATKYRASGDEPVEIYDAGDINIAVIGGGTANASKLIAARYETTVPVDPWR